MNHLAHLRHFEIEAADVERAKRFYELVFGWKISPWGPPDYYLIDTGAPVVTGDIRKLHGPDAEPNRGFVCTVGVENLRAVKEAVASNGGKIIVPEYRIEGVGNLFYFADTEGNRVGAMKYDGG
jgi:predicted enzyme related to lactoylglutathione lyase